LAISAAAHASTLYWKIRWTTPRPPLSNPGQARTIRQSLVQAVAE
jgi:hypothetical protein